MSVKKTLASAGVDKEIRLWSLRAGRFEPKSVPPLQDHLGAVTALAFSPDGKTLASGSEDEMIRLWDPELGDLRAKLDGHADAVTLLAFRHDSRMLVSAGEDETVKFWFAPNPID